MQAVDYGIISLKLKETVKYSVTWHAEMLLAYNFIYFCFVLLLSCLLCFLVLYSPMVKFIECENIILKTEQKITYVTQLEQVCWTYPLSPGPSSWVFTVKCCLPSSCCGYWQVLSGRQYLPKLCLCLGQTDNFVISSWDGWNSPPFAKIISYSVTFTRERWQLFKW